MPTGLPCGCNGCLPDGRTHPSWRAYKARLGEGCTGNGGRSRAYAVGSDRGKYESAAIYMPGSAILCIRPSGNRYCSRIWPYYSGDWRGSCCGCGRCISVLRDACRAFGAAEYRWCKAGNYCIENCSTCGRHCERSKRSQGYRRPNGRRA